MSLLIAAVLATAPAPVPACSWNHPGHRAFMGDVVAAVDRYQDIPAPVRARLKQRMAQRQYDEIVTIGRDSITGRARYRAQIRDMHFGDGQVCRSVDRSGWKPDAQERGLVYCEDGHCILVPTVCRNVSRIQREGPAVAGAGGQIDDAAGPAGAVPRAPGGQAGPAQATGPSTGADAVEAGATALPAVAGVRAEADLGLPGVLPAAAGAVDESAGGAGGALSGPSFTDLAQDRPGRVGTGDEGTTGSDTGNRGAGTPLGNLSGSPQGGGGLGGGGLGGGALPPSPPPPPVPEPGTALLMLGGLAALLRWCAGQGRR